MTLEEREAALAQREAALAQREAALAKREADLLQRETALAQAGIPIPPPVNIPNLPTPSFEKTKPPISTNDRGPKIPMPDFLKPVSEKSKKNTQLHDYDNVEELLNEYKTVLGGAVSAQINTILRAKDWPDIRNYISGSRWLQALRDEYDGYVPTSGKMPMEGVWKMTELIEELYDDLISKGYDITERATKSDFKE